MTTSTTSFRAMGGTATVIVEGRRTALGAARRRLADLEAKWSRFRADSEISRLNAARRTAQPTSADTRLLVRCAATAWARTAGAFDPTVLDAVIAWGYDRNLDQVDHRVPPARPQPAPGFAAVVIDELAGTVDLGGVGFDPGGIGKGLAADLVAAELVAAGAEAALVNVGGDLRIAGSPPGGAWTVGLEDPTAPDLDLVRMRLAGGGVATSSDRRRRWRLVAPGAEAHHLLDPSTGAPAATALAGVSVVAGEAWWAEALTKALLLGRLDLARLPGAGASGIGRTRAGDVVGTHDLLELWRGAA